MIEHGAWSSGATLGVRKNWAREVRALLEAEQLKWRVGDAQHPAREEAGVLGEEAVLATLVGAHVTEAIADDEGASVQHAERPLRQRATARSAARCATVR